MFQAPKTKTTKRSPVVKGEAYAKKKQGQARRDSQASKEHREVGPLPPVANPERRAACERDLLLFNSTYFPRRFPLPWGHDHLEFIGDLQRILTEGGQQAESLPRGTGKTTLCETAGIWAIAYGHRRFLVLLGATQGKADELLDNVKGEIETNTTLAADFPELCHCVVRLEGINHRAAGQLLDNVRTRIQWRGDTLRFPTITDSPSSGSIIVSEGLTGSIRGLTRRTAEGEKIRPDACIIDDPQTDDSARSPLQNDVREMLVKGTVLGLAGPGKKIAAIMPCTPIRPNDMVDRILDRGRCPEWHGRRCSLLPSMPDRLDLWDQYAELLREGLRRDPPDREEANEFYIENREDMDRGAVASWDARFDPDQVSAIQYAMDIFLLNPRVFAAEYQCRPILDNNKTGGALPIDGTAVMQRVNKVPRGELPPECTRITAGVDVQQEIIYWLVTGWDERFGGHILDYGTFPKQSLSQFTAADPDNPLSVAFPGSALEARVYAGLETVAAEVLGRQWPRFGGGDPARIERALVDSGYLTDTIHQWARQTAAAAIVTPAKGQFVGAKKTPFSDWKPQPGERWGNAWRLKAAPTARGRLAILDTNYWKSWLAERLRSEAGTPGAMFLFGGNPAVHSMFADHLTAEFPVRQTEGSRTVDEWELHPGRPENHWFDCLYLAAAAAAVSGLKWSSSGAPEPPRSNTPIDPAELYKAAQDLPVL